MKKLMLVTIVVLGTAAMTFAQTGRTETGTLSIGTDILAALDCQMVHDLNLGSAVQGQAKTVNPTDNGTGIQAGEFKVSGDSIMSVIFTFSADANLALTTDNTKIIPFTQATPVHNSTESQTGTTPFAGVGGGTITLAGGVVYVYVGGTITVAGNQAAGHYTGTYTLTVQYQ